MGEFICVASFSIRLGNGEHKVIRADSTWRKAQPQSNEFRLENNEGEHIELDRREFRKYFEKVNSRRSGR